MKTASNPIGDDMFAALTELEQCVSQSTGLIALLAQAATCDRTADPMTNRAEEGIKALALNTEDRLAKAFAATFEASRREPTAGGRAGKLRVI